MSKSDEKHLKPHPYKPKPARKSHSLNDSYVWTRQRRQRPRQGRGQAPPQGSARQHRGDIAPRHPSPRSPRRDQAPVRTRVRGDPLGAQGLHHQHRPRRHHLHRACSSQDRHRQRRGVCAPSQGQDALRFWELNPMVYKDTCHHSHQTHEHSTRCLYCRKEAGI